jgi:hypothetical protein
MKLGKNTGTIWASLIGGMLAGAYIKPMVLPSGFAGLHGMGASGDVLIAGICVGLAYVTYRLLFGEARGTQSHSAAALK